MAEFLRPRFLLSLLAAWTAISAPAQVNVQIGQNFSGSDNSTTFITPADGNGCIGPNDFVEFINGSFAVYDKTTGQNVYAVSDLDFWFDGGVGLPADNDVTDPRVIFDSTSQRWFASQVDFNASAADPTIYANNYLIGVSDTADPAGTWHAFRIRANPLTRQFADFPTLGVDGSAVYLSGDMLTNSVNVGASLTMLPKADLLASPPVVTNRKFLGTFDYSQRGAVMQPASCFDGSGSGNLLAADDFFGGSQLVGSTVLNPGTPGATLAPPAYLSVPAYTVPINPTQPDGSQSLANNDARVSSRIYTVAGVIYVAQNVEIGSHAAIQWYRVSATNDALLETGTIADPDLDLFFPSIAANSNGIVVIGCNGCGPSTYISSFAYVGLTTGGVTTFGNRRLLAAGGYNYHDLNDQTSYLLDDTWSESRWGDYSATSVDPANPSHFWTIQMLPFYDSNSDYTGGAAAFWHTQITELIVTLQSPPLTLSPAGRNVTLAWPSWAAGFQLQSSTNLANAGGWQAVSQTPVSNGNQLSVSLPVTNARTFFRLEH